MYKNPQVLLNDRRVSCYKAHYDIHISRYHKPDYTRTRKLLVSSDSNFFRFREHEVDRSIQLYDHDSIRHYGIGISCLVLLCTWSSREPTALETLRLDMVKERGDQRRILDRKRKHPYKSSYSCFRFLIATSTLTTGNYLDCFLLLLRAFLTSWIILDFAGSNRLTGKQRRARIMEPYRFCLWPRARQNGFNYSYLATEFHREFWIINRYQ